MKAAFVFDTVLIKEKNNFYGMTLTYDFFKKRYLSIYDKIIVITRYKEKKEEFGNISGYKKTNGKNVEVTPIRLYRDVPDAIKNYSKIYVELLNILNNVDVVIVRMPSILGMFACKICQDRAKNYIVEMVACPWDNYMNHARFGGKILAPFMFFMTKKCVKNAPKVIYVTNRFLQKRYPTKGMQCACSDVILKSLNGKDILSKRIEKIKESNVKCLNLCTVANVGLKYKGQKYVIKAISELNKCGYNFKYYLIGNGNQAKLRKLVNKERIQNNVIFVGSLPHDEIFHKLQEMDIYIQPSLQEGLPRALIEAMSVGLPCFGSTAGGIPELLEENVIFKKKSVRQIKQYLRTITKDALIDMVKRNYKVATKYDYNNLYEKRLNFYKSDFK